MFKEMIMTIKVIKKRSKAVVKKITCDNCGAVLEYAPIDVKERNGTDIREIYGRP
jgi:hypothetical protein